MNIPKKILIIQTAFIGDAILSSSLVESWANKFPDSTIDILVRKGNESLFNHDPHLHEVLVWDKKKHKYRNLFSLVKKIRKAKYDAVFNVQRFFSTGLLTLLSGAKFKSGFSANPLSFFFDHKVLFDTREAKHETERNILLFEAFYRDKALRPRLYPSKEDDESCLVYKGKKYVCLAPTSVWFTKQWPKENWVELIKAIDRSTAIYLLGAPSDVADCQAILDAAECVNVFNLAGKLSFLQSASLMKDASMNYVNDSAPMHISSAMNAPTTAIYCSTIPAFGFGPLSDDATIIEFKGELKCRPCGLHGRRSCPENHFKCSRTLDQVLSYNERS
jgi:heptosyltransferase-2